MYDPDELGENCNIVQNALQFPPDYVATNGSMPNFPRFRVDAEEPCDPSIHTALEEFTYDTRQLTAYPNPATDYINVDIPDEARLVLRNVQGQLWYDQQVTALLPTQRIDVTKVPAGICHVSLWVEGEQVVYVTGVSVVR